MPVPDLTICTLVRNRNQMLRRLLQGVERSTRPPAEVLVAVAGGEDPAPVTASVTTCPVRLLDLGSDDERIPYSLARNRCAAEVETSALVFLDADCIPSSSFVQRISDALDQIDALVAGEVLYLPPGETPEREDELFAAGRPHPHRLRPPTGGWQVHARHELMWGLCMAMRTATFDELGGFDTSFTGYAGEDTDLAVRARGHGVPAAMVADAAVFHQHHHVWEPPLQQFDATLRNARRFRDKWGRWPMEGWLREFEALGLIQWRPGGEDLEILRHPTEDEVRAARRATALPFRTAQAA